MPQVDGSGERWGGALDGAYVTVVGCPRRDCHIIAFAASEDGPWEPAPQFMELLATE